MENKGNAFQGSGLVQLELAFDTLRRDQVPEVFLNPETLDISGTKPSPRPKTKTKSRD
jgi:hypothetical protein